MIIALVLTVSSGCRVLKKKERSERSESQSELKLDLSTKKQTLEVLHFGDTLRGISPVIRDGRPQRIQSESAGVKLDITLTDSTISYQVTAKPVAKESFKIDIEDVQAHIEASEEKTSETAEKEVKSSGIPWWLYLIGALLIVGWLAWKYHDITNPILIWQKLIAGLRK